MTNTLKLKAKILENGKTIQSLAEELEMSVNTLSFKVNNKREFTIKEVDAIKEALHLSNQEIMDIFFSAKMCL